MRRLVPLLLAALALASVACGDDDAPPAGPPAAHAPASAAPPPDEPEPDYDADDPAYSLLAESEAADRTLVARAGHRADFRVRAAAVRGLHDGPLAHAVVALALLEIEPGAPGYARLNPEQRTVYALTWADDEILNGGFWQFFYNSTGAVAPDLVDAAARVHAPAYEAVFRAARALFPGGRIPRDDAERRRAIDGFTDADYAKLDDPYAALQYRRATNLGPILGRYVESHRAAFIAG